MGGGRSVRMTGASTPRGSTERELLKLGHENFIEAFRRVARALPSGRIEEDRDCVCIASGLAGPEFNPVFLSPTASDPFRSIRAASGFMERAGVPAWRLVVLSGRGSDASGAARSAGLVPRRTLPGMLLCPIPPAVRPTPPELRVVLATDRELWETMVRVGLVGFGGEAPEDVDTILPYPGHATARGYVAYWGDRPVGTSLAIDHAGIAGVYFVSALPEARRKGVGAAVTLRAAVDGLAAGCRASYLQSSEMGFNLYRTLGYRHLATYQEWTSAPEP